MNNLSTLSNTIPYHKYIITHININQNNPSINHILSNIPIYSTVIILSNSNSGIIIKLNNSSKIALDHLTANNIFVSHIV